MKTTDYSTTGWHRRCDEVFREMEQAILQHRWTEADSLCKEFIASMEYHFKIEEELLFPILVNAGTQAIEPVNAMIMRHDDMRQLMAQLTASLDNMFKSLSADCVEVLLVNLKQQLSDNTTNIVDDIAKGYSESA